MRRQIHVIFTKINDRAEKVLSVVAERVRGFDRYDGFFAATSLRAARVAAKALAARGHTYDTDIARVVCGPHGDAVWGCGDKNGFGPSRKGMERVRALLRSHGITHT